MKYDKFFELAKKAGIEDCELNINQSTSLEFSLFHGEIDNYSSNSSSTYLARGIYKGKLGAITSDVFTKDSPEQFVNAIVSNASVIENDDPVFIFKGSEKYHKINTFNRELSKIPVEDKLNKLFELEKKIKEGDPRIIEIETVGYEESSSTLTILKSNGLKLTQKNNDFAYYGGAVAKEGEQVKTGFDFFFSNDFSKFDVDKLAKSIVKETTSKLGGHQCESATYKAVLSQDVMRAFILAYIGSAVAEDIQKKSSLFVDKLNQKVASKKVTISDNPLSKTIFARGFDGEGVATRNMVIIKNGILQNYLYNLTTAAKEGIESNGHGTVGGGSRVGTTTWYLEMKAGKKTLEQLCEEVGTGVYITDVQGLHAGMNERSGNFSLQSTGFMIENGKITHGLDIITVSGNLVDLFNSISEVGSDSKEFANGIKCPSVIVKKIAVSGK
ncbi:MAG: TldD/PmbA family protein [Bacilli bacterium]|nr:TldD/PmbA family protein [Bacilli bacterium]